MYLSPIILFVYNRPVHTKKTVEALKLNQFASDSSLFIFSDGNKDAKDKKSVDEVRKYIPTISGFKEIKIILRDKNFGLADSVISGVTEIINQYGKAIVLEDDIVTSPYFLKFINEALDFYEKNKRIYSISGYTFPIKLPKGYSLNYFVAYRTSSWGWATWKDRWEKAIWNPEQFLDLKNLNTLNNFVDKAGKDIAPMLLKSIAGKINSWSVKWSFTHIKYGVFSIYPTHSLAQNIGVDGSGTNFNRVINKYMADIEVGQNIFYFSNELILLEEIQEQINKLVQPGIVSFIKYRIFGVY